MMFEDELFRKRLRRMISTLPGSEESKEDIQQDLLILLRDLEQKHPQQTPSWYLQACKFRAKHLLAAGRSIDSPKRARLRVTLPDDSDLADEILNPIQDRDGVFFSDVSAKNIEELLGARLSRTERRILLLLKEGYTLRQIGAKLGVSHPTILQYRKKIERLARQIGLQPCG